MSSIEGVRELILSWVNSPEGADVVDGLFEEYEALVELRALQNIVGIKVGPVE